MTCALCFVYFYFTSITCTSVMVRGTWRRGVNSNQQSMVVLEALEAMAELGALEAMAGGLRGLGLATRPGHQSRDYIAPQKTLGETYGAEHRDWSTLRAECGNWSPSWATLRNSSPPGLHSGTGLSTGTGAHSGLGSEPEALSGHDESTAALLGLDVESGALSGFTQEPLPYQQQEKQAAREWPPRP